MLALNTLNLLYMLMAFKYQAIFQRPDLGRADFGLVCALVSAEALGAGFGNAAFTVFIMRTTKTDHKAAHFAIGTGLMNIAGTLAGVVSGFIAARVGFVAYFGMTMVAALPSMCLIPFLPLLDDEPKRGGGTVTRPARRVGVVAAELEGERTGVGRVLEGLLEGVRELPLDWQWRLFFQGHPFDHPLWADPRFVPVFSGRAGSRVAWEQLVLPLALTRHRLDLLYSPAYSLPPWRGPRVVSLHDLSFERLPEEFAPRERWRRRLLARWAAHRAARVLVDSGRVRREVVELYRLDPGRVGVLPLPVDPRFRPAAAAEVERDLEALAGLGVEPPYLLHAGTLLDRRCLPLVLADLRPARRGAPRVDPGAGGRRPPAGPGSAAAGGGRDRAGRPGPPPRLGARPRAPGPLPSRGAVAVPLDLRGLRPAAAGVARLRHAGGGARGAGPGRAVARLPPALQAVGRGVRGGGGARGARRFDPRPGRRRGPGEASGADPGRGGTGPGGRAGEGVKTAAVVVSHDSARVLPRCLESLAEAAAGGLEVLVVDGGSEDGSPDLVRAQFPFARVLELGGNRGFGAAVNWGATEVPSDALLLLNPDAWLVGQRPRPADRGPRRGPAPGARRPPPPLPGRPTPVRLGAGPGGGG